MNVGDCSESSWQQQRCLCQVLWWCTYRVAHLPPTRPRPAPGQRSSTISGCPHLQSSGLLSTVLPEQSSPQCCRAAMPLLTRTRGPTSPSSDKLDHVEAVNRPINQLPYNGRALANQSPVFYVHINPIIHPRSPDSYQESAFQDLTP